MRTFQDAMLETRLRNEEVKVLHGINRVAAMNEIWNGWEWKLSS